MKMIDKAYENKDYNLIKEDIKQIIIDNYCPSDLGFKDCENKSGFCIYSCEDCWNREYEEE